MTTYNKKQIFSNAWNLVKTTGVKIGQALSTAWAIAKSALIVIAAPMAVLAPEATHTVVVNSKKHEVAIVNNTVNINGIEYAVKTIEKDIYDRFAMANIGKLYILVDSQRYMLNPIGVISTPAPVREDSFRRWNELEGCYETVYTENGKVVKICPDY